MNKSFIQFLIFLTLASLAGSTPIDNGVVGEPEMECGADALYVNFLTENAFEGHVFVKGHYNEPGCRVPGDGRNTASFRLPFGACGMQRLRSTNPRGVYVSSTVIITFHPMLLTKIDRAYDFRCFYMEADKTVSAELDVSMLTTQVQSDGIAMPICRYEVLRDGPTGPPVRYAVIGDHVYHKWTCESEMVGVFCMMVHSCTVDNGAGKVVELLDGDGCAQDRYLLQNLEYDSEGLMAGKGAHVFKFADRPTLYFNCQIGIFVKNEGVCERPSCPDPTRGKRDAPSRSYNLRLDSYDQDPINSLTTVDVASTPVNVFELDADPGQIYENAQEILRQDADVAKNLGRVSSVNGGGSQYVCLSNAVFSAGMAFIALILIAIITCSIVLVYTRRRLNEKSVSVLSVGHY